MGVVRGVWGVVDEGARGVLGGNASVAENGRERETVGGDKVVCG